MKNILRILSLTIIIIFSSFGLANDTNHDGDFLILADKEVTPKKEDGVVFFEIEKIKFTSSQNIFAILEPLGGGGVPTGAKMKVSTYHVWDEIVTLAESKTIVSKGERKLSVGANFKKYSPHMNVSVLVTGVKIGTKYRLIVTSATEMDR